MIIELRGLLEVPGRCRLMTALRHHRVLDERAGGGDRMDEPGTESVWDHFDSTWLADFAGLSLTAALEKAEAEGRPVRVLHPWSDMTLDFRPDRLNLRLDAAGDLDEMSAG